MWLAFLKASPALAAIDNATNPDNKLPSSLKDTITTVSNTILTLVGVVAVLFLIIGGFQYIASAGNPDSVGKAKNTILYAVIGIVVTILSYAAVQFIITNIK